MEFEMKFLWWPLSLPGTVPYKGQIWEVFGILDHWLPGKQLSHGVAGTKETRPEVDVTDDRTEMYSLYEARKQYVRQQNWLNILRKKKFGECKLILLY